VIDLSLKKMEEAIIRNLALKGIIDDYKCK